jgi:hypothetical protein
MNKLSTILFAAVVFGGLALAQDTSPRSPSPQSSPADSSHAPFRIAPGTVFPVTLAKSIDAKKVKAGDLVEAKVTVDLKGADGEMVVPKGSTVVGHVTQAQARTKEQKESLLGLTFDHLVMKGGGDVPLPVSIQAIIAPSRLDADNSAGGGYAPAPGGVQPGGGGFPGGAGMPPQAPGPPGGMAPSPVPPSTQEHPAITGNTQGVVGFSNLKLSPAADPAQGSLLSSNKSNVKLESGTLVILHVNP